MSHPRQVLVTGATGFVGRRLMSSLAGHGYDATSASGRVERELSGPRGVGVVVHLAARTYVPDSWADPLAYYETNLLGTLRVLEYCRSEGSRLVFVSSYVYGTPERLPIPETAPRRPTNPYAHSKVLAEESCEFYAASMGVDALIIRPFNIYGPGQDPRFLVSSLAHQLLDPGCQVVMVKDARPRRDYLYVDDMVELLVAAVGSDQVGAVNAGSGVSHSVQEVYEVLTEVARIAKPLRTSGDERRGEIPDVVADTDHARAVLGWSARTELSEGLRRVVEDLRRAL